MNPHELILGYAKSRIWTTSGQYEHPGEDYIEVEAFIIYIVLLVQLMFNLRHCTN